MAAKLTYKRRLYSFPFHLPKEDDFSDIRFLEHLGPEGNDRVLFVLDYVPGLDLKTRDLLSGNNQGFLLNLIEQSRQLYKHKPFTWYAAAYHACRTIGKSPEFQRRAYAEFHQRLLYMIQEIKPTVLVLFGKQQFEALCPIEYAKCEGLSKAYIGVPLTKTLALPDGQKHTLSVTRLPSISAMVDGAPTSNLAGYTARGLANALAKKVLFKAELPEYKLHVVDTVPKFDSMMRILRKAKAVSLDTEDDNLNRIVNRVLTVQFAVDTKKAWILPFCHKDSKFTAKELRYIADELRDYFETNDNDYHIYVNAQYDLCTMRSQFGVRFYKAPIWDVPAGEFCLDENLVELAILEKTNRMRGGSYFGLLNIACQYGNFAYLETSFKKSDRANIKSLDLSDDVLEYAGLDVLLPFAIHEAQKRKAKAMGYAKFEQMVVEMQSDVIHAIHGLEYTGYKIDIPYLFRMKLPDSPINVAIKTAEEALLASEGARKANAILIKRHGLPQRGLFGGQQMLLDIGKDEHKQILFVDALGLKPLAQGSKQQALFDDKFQKEYAHVEEVRLFTEWSKAVKLRNAYVNQMLGFWGEQDDFKTDMRVRCRYDYSKVTGRLSASKPGLQQIPTHGPMAKYVKRMFIAEKGTLIVKVDFRVHEVRGWGIISSDGEVAKAFRLGQELIEKYKLRPDGELLERIESEGDIHKVNAAYFFRKTIAKVTKADRNAIKGVVFGLVYGMSDESLSVRIKQSLEDTLALVKAFMVKFPRGVKWFDLVEKQAKERYFVESPLGRRRNLFGYMLPANTRAARKVHGRMSRLSRNAPIQGMSSDFMMIGARNLQKAVWQHYLDTGYLPDIRACISVHDSLECQVGYGDLLLAIRLIEESLTTQVQRVVKERHGFDCISDLMLDFELGASGDSLAKWTYEVDSYSYDKVDGSATKTVSVTGLRDIVKRSLDFQQTELGYEQDKRALYRSVFHSPTSDYMPLWMKKQMSASRRP